MIASHVHDALDQVRRLQSLVMERKNFRGYSGRGRIFGGLAALCGAVVMSLPGVLAASDNARLAGWGVVLALGLLLNYGSLIHWFLYSPEARRSLDRLVPAFDALPALGMGGGVFSVVDSSRSNYSASRDVDGIVWFGACALPQQSSWSQLSCWRVLHGLRGFFSCFPAALCECLADGAGIFCG